MLLFINIKSENIQENTVWSVIYQFLLRVFFKVTQNQIMSKLVKNDAAFSLLGLYRVV